MARLIFLLFQMFTSLPNTLAALDKNRKGGKCIRETRTEHAKLNKQGYIYTVGHKKTCHFILHYNFGVS